jgi:hypothetical protein
MVAELMFVVAALATQQTQKARCAPNAIDKDVQRTNPEMACVDRNGHCVSVTIDGKPTVALTDETIAARVHAIKHGEDVCWRLTEPVSTQFRVVAGMGGIVPKFVGTLEQVRVNLYSLGDYDPKVDSRLDSLNGIEMRADGAPSGTWQLRSERPLPAGEYLAVFRVTGVGNWDRQAVLLTLDPKLAPIAPKSQ